MRDPQPSSRSLRSTAGWTATLALVLAACLNPRPEELPSADGIEGAGSPSVDDNDAVVDQAPAPAVPASPGPSANPSNGQEPSDPAESPEPTVVDRDGGTDTPDAGAPDAS